MRLCRCGAVTKERLCEQCRARRQTTHAKTTKERGYGNDWRKLSERQRAERPLCEVCDARGRVEPATQLHHIAKVRDAPEQRLRVDNTLAVCVRCHEAVEGMNRLELHDYMKQLAKR